MASTPSIPVYLGDDWSFPFTYKDANGAPIDLTGFDPGGELLFSASKHDLTVGNGGATLVDAPAGKFRLDVDQSVTETLPDFNSATRLHVFVLDPAGEKKTLAVIPLTVVRP